MEINGHFYESARGLIDKIIAEGRKGEAADEGKILQLRRVVLGEVEQTHIKFGKAYDEIEKLKHKIALDSLNDENERSKDNGSKKSKALAIDQRRYEMYFNALSKIGDIYRYDTDLSVVHASSRNKNFIPIIHPYITLQSEEHYLEIRSYLSGLHKSKIISEPNFDKFMDAYFVYPDKKSIPLTEKIDINVKDKDEVISLVYKIASDWVRYRNTKLLLYVFVQILCDAFTHFEQTYNGIRGVYTKLNDHAGAFPKTGEYFALNQLKPK